MDNNIDLQKTVLSSIINYPEYYDQIIDIINPECFIGENKRLYETITSLKEKDIAVDNISLFSHGFKNAVYLTSLPQIYTDINIIYHARLLYENYVRKKLMDTASNLNTETLNPIIDVFELIDKNIDKLKNLGIGDITDNEHISEAVKEVDKIVENVQNGIENNNYVPTGFFTYDSVWKGFFNSTLIVLAARPGQGKTAFALELLKNISARRKGLFFSLEMGRKELVGRMIASESGINSFRIKIGNIYPSELERYAEASRFIESLPIFIDDKSKTTDQIKHKSRRYKRNYDIGFIGIDYLQLVSGKGDNREREIGNISRDLKLLSKELDLPVLLLSQLNRQVESRPDKLPMLFDLRDSGSIEQDADDIIFLMRPESYDQIYMPRTQSPNVEGNSFFEVAKSRGNQTGHFELNYIKELTKFKDWEIKL